MAIIRQYKLVAASGREGDLRDALSQLAARVVEIDGCAFIDLMRSSTDPAAFVFVEHWLSSDHYAEGSSALGKEAFASVMAVLAGRPEALTLEPVAAWPDGGRGS